MALQILTLGFCDVVETFIRKCHCFESDSLGGRAAVQSACLGFWYLTDMGAISGLLDFNSDGTALYKLLTSSGVSVTSFVKYLFCRVV